MLALTARFRGSTLASLADRVR